MTMPATNMNDCEVSAAGLAELLHQLPAGRRGALLQLVASFEPSATIEESFDLGPLRAAFAGYWESLAGKAVPISRLRSILWPPVNLQIAVAFQQLVTTRTVSEIAAILPKLVENLVQRVEQAEAAISGASGAATPVQETDLFAEPNQLDIYQQLAQLHILDAEHEFHELLSIVAPPAPHHP
jgi:hypothetical protein